MADSFPAQECECVASSVCWKGKQEAITSDSFFCNVHGSGHHFWDLKEGVNIFMSGLWQLRHGHHCGPWLHWQTLSPWTKGTFFSSMIVWNLPQETSGYSVYIKQLF